MTDERRVFARRAIIFENEDVFGGCWWVIEFDGRTF